MLRGIVLKIGVGAILVVMLSTAGLQAREQILDKVRIDEKGECAMIQVEFGFPVRYVNHFPSESGDDLRIQFEPITISQGDEDAVFTRESHRPPPNEIASLLEVVYEGHIEGGPFLTLFFRTNVKFRVEQGVDFRSLIIFVQGHDASEPCTLRP